MRSYILLIGLLIFSVNTFADWLTKAVRDPLGKLSQYSLRSSEDFPQFTVSCVSFDASPIDMFQIDRLTNTAIDSIERIEIRVDSNRSMIFIPEQHKINTAFQYHSQIASGIETVTLTPSDISGEDQFVELLRQFIEGRRGRARVVSATTENEVTFSLIGFTQAYLSMRTACLNSEST